MLKGIGYAATEVAGALKDVFLLNGEAIVGALNGIGYGLKEIKEGINGGLRHRPRRGHDHHVLRLPAAGLPRRALRYRGRFSPWAPSPARRDFIQPVKTA